MIGSIAFVLLGAAAAATPCENLANLKLQNATITSAKLAPEGPAPAAVPAGAEMVPPHVEAVQPFLRLEPHPPAIKVALERAAVVEDAEAGLPQVSPRTAASSWISNQHPTPSSRWNSGSPPRTGTESSWEPGMEDSQDPSRAWGMTCHRLSGLVTPLPVRIPATRIQAANGRSAIRIR